jgi:hypothetical protein
MENVQLLDELLKWWKSHVARIWIINMENVQLLDEQLKWWNCHVTRSLIINMENVDELLKWWNSHVARSWVIDLKKYVLYKDVFLSFYFKVRWQNLRRITPGEGEGGCKVVYEFF